MIIVPILYGFAAGEIVRLIRSGRAGFARLAIFLAIVITAVLFTARSMQTRDVVAARAEQFENWGGFDPRPALREIKARGYAVCYADVWVAHKLEWLSDSGVRIIPYRSVNRRMVDSLGLASLPGSKCFIDHRGRVRTLREEEQAEMRLDLLWQVHGWTRPFRGVTASDPTP
jgi:hypothetical protein